MAITDLKVGQWYWCGHYKWYYQPLSIVDNSEIQANYIDNYKNLTKNSRIANSTFWKDSETREATQEEIREKLEAIGTQEALLLLEKLDPPIYPIF